MLIPFSTDFAILIFTATGLGFLLHRLGQPTIIAYILTGFLLGPAVFGAVTQSHLIGFLSELGLAFLLFFLGIEMNLSELKDIFWSLLRITARQRVLQIGLAAVTAWLLGFTGTETALIAFATVFGATPVIVKLLNETGDLNSPSGRINVGVLVLQDIYVVLLLALLSAESMSSASLIAYSVSKILALIALIGGIAYLASKYVVPTIFERVERSKHAFFIHGIAWAFIFISLSAAFDLPVEIGAFLAGLGLGQMSFHGELKERVRPLTLFFMVVFFSSIGLQLSLSNLTSYWVEALIAGATLMVGNAAIMYYAIRREQFSPKTSFIGAINMTQASEFTLVAGSVAVTHGIVSGDVLGFLSIMALATMTVSALLINYNKELHTLAKPWLPPEEDAVMEVKSREDHTLIVGFDDSMKALLPKIQGEVCVVDNDAETMSYLEATPHDCLYGNFFHEEMRGEADLANASLVISVIPSLPISKHILRDVDDATVIVKALNEDEAAELYDLGADYVIVKDAVMAERLAEVIQAWCDDASSLRRLGEEEQRRIREAAT